MSKYPLPLSSVSPNAFKRMSMISIESQIYTNEIITIKSYDILFAQCPLTFI